MIDDTCSLCGEAWTEHSRSGDCPQFDDDDFKGIYLVIWIIFFLLCLWWIWVIFTE